MITLLLLAYLLTVYLLAYLLAYLLTVYLLAYHNLSVTYYLRVNHTPQRADFRAYPPAPPFTRPPIPSRLQQFLLPLVTDQFFSGACRILAPLQPPR